MHTKSKPINFRKVTVTTRGRGRSKRFILMAGTRELRTRFHENGFSNREHAEMTAYWLRRGAPKQKGK
jgi:hypothetical protein